MELNRKPLSSLQLAYLCSGQSDCIKKNPSSKEKKIDLKLN